MQITSQRQPYTTQNTFKGLRNKDARALIALDLDGTLAHGTNEDIQRVVRLSQKANATLAYVTGRTLQDFYKLQQKCAKSGIDLETPKQLIASNGPFIYEKNNNGELIEDTEWKELLNKKTNFHKPAVYQAIHDLAQQPKYQYSEDEIKKLEQFNDPILGGFEERKKDDADFWNSKISFYEWSPSDHYVEYHVGHDVNVGQLKKDIKKTLAAQGIKTKFIFQKYDKENIDNCSTSIIRRVRPLRESTDGTVRGLFLCPAHKADAVKYLGQKLNIPNEEILTAGNDSNDWSLANFSKKGSFFVCVGNALPILFDHAKRIKSNTIIFAQEHGAKGVAEGIEQVLAKFGQK